jgi:hypothetical protein
MVTGQMQLPPEQMLANAATVVSWVDALQANQR